MTAMVAFEFYRDQTTQSRAPFSQPDGTVKVTRSGSTCVKTYDPGVSAAPSGWSAKFAGVADGAMVALSAVLCDGEGPGPPTFGPDRTLIPMTTTRAALAERDQPP
jgi:hypothetical protein